jgi:hypothetical protein
MKVINLHLLAGFSSETEARGSARARAGTYKRMGIH